MELKHFSRNSATENTSTTSLPISLNLLKWWNCCLVQVVASFWRANSHIIAFFKLALGENRTCDNKPTMLGMLKNDMRSKSVCDGCFSLTETGSQADAVAPVEPSFCPGHVRSHHHAFAMFALWDWGQTDRNTDGVIDLCGKPWLNRELLIRPVLFVSVCVIKVKVPELCVWLSWTVTRSPDCSCLSIRTSCGSRFSPFQPNGWIIWDNSNLSLSVSLTYLLTHTWWLHCLFCIHRSLEIWHLPSWNHWLWSLRL